MALCTICKRELDNPADPTTRNLGGDCLLCMAEAGDPDARMSLDALSGGIEGDKALKIAARIPARGIWWWFSFVNPDLPEGQQFLGGAAVQGLTATDALARSHILEINPGGEAAFDPFPNGLVPPEEYRERLLNQAECQTLQTAILSFGGEGGA